MKPLELCIILNGPPRSGKDTLAKLLVSGHGFKKHQMKDTLYEATAEHFDCSVAALKRVAMDRLEKEKPFSMLQGMSPREALIHVSETLIKPIKGKDYFGKAQALACVSANSLKTVFSDGGFPEEIEPLQKVFKRVVIYHLHKEGTSFNGDSRDYIRGFPNTHRLQVIDDETDMAILEILLKLRDFSRQPREAALDGRLAGGGG